MRKNNSLKWIYFFTFLTLVFLIIFLFFYFSSNEIEVIKVNFVVDEVSAFDLNKSVLSFGKVIPGTSISRNIVLENKRDYPVNVLLKSSSNLEGFLFFERNIFLNSSENKKVTISLNVPLNFSKGNYSGELVVVVRK